MEEGAKTGPVDKGLRGSLLFVDLELDLTGECRDREIEEIDLPNLYSGWVQLVHENKKFLLLLSCNI